VAQRPKRSPFNLETMEARSVAELPEERGWQFEPKWDGFRCLAMRSGDRVELRSRSGKPLSRYFPEVVARLQALPHKEFMLDGELVVPIGAVLSFDALQARLHPAESRVRKLAAQTPATLILFDCLLAPKGRATRVLVDASLVVRREALEAFVASIGKRDGLVLTPYTRNVRTARGWLKRLGGSLDGVVAKKMSDPYQPGERAMLKIKRLRTADCVVGGFRYGTKRDVVGSLLLGLFNESGKLDHVGFTSSIPVAGRRELTSRLEKLREPPGFTGNAPGGPSRWSTERSTEWEPLRPELVVEVCYDHVTSDRFRHGTRLLRWRPDKAPKQCTLYQLRQEARPAKLIRELLAGSPRGSSAKSS
jgi:ATP-dependent DNA ligase